MRLLPILTVPRSGSEVFCNALRDGGLRCAYEINHPAYRKLLAQEFSADLESMDLQATLKYLSNLAPDDNGMAYKVFYSDSHSVPIEALVADITPIYLERFDFVSQVVSFVAMWTSGHALDDVRHTFRSRSRGLDEDLVKASIAFLRHERRMWARKLARQNVLRIQTETLFDDPVSVFQRVASTLATYGIVFDWKLASSSIRKTRPYDQDAELKAQVRADYAHLLNPLNVAAI